MADLGAIATRGGRISFLTAGSNGDVYPPGLRALWLGMQYHALGAGRSDSLGNPSAPSLRMDRRGRFPIRWPVRSGTRTFAIQCKMTRDPGIAASRPRIIIRANPDIGVNADVTTVASTGTGWQALVAQASPTSNGVLEVILEHRYPSNQNPAAGVDMPGDGFMAVYWDQIVSS